LIIVQKQSGANSVQIANSVKERLPEIMKSLPTDIKIDTIIDTSTNILKPLMFGGNDHDYLLSGYGCRVLVPGKVESDLYYHVGNSIP
jgi:hypothetical protein